MPLYEYQCESNGHRFEVRHGMTEEPVQVCQVCGAPVRRVIHPVGIVFKGSGFYATDSRKSESSPKSSESKSDTASESKSGTKKSEPAAEKAS